jgi:hypothetical protein
MVTQVLNVRQKCAAQLKVMSDTGWQAIVRGLPERQQWQGEVKRLRLSVHDGRGYGV